MKFFSFLLTCCETLQQAIKEKFGYFIYAIKWSSGSNIEFTISIYKKSHVKWHKHYLNSLLYEVRLGLIITQTIIVIYYYAKKCS